MARNATLAAAARVRRVRRDEERARRRELRTLLRPRGGEIRVIKRDVGETRVQRQQPNKATRRSRGETDFCLFVFLTRI